MVEIIKAVTITISNLLELSVILKYRIIPYEANKYNNINTKSNGILI